MAAETPIGTVTLVFTDIVGSTELWDRHRTAFQPVLEEHDRLMRIASAGPSAVTSASKPCIRTSSGVSL
jgi:hypothetical protein